MYKFILAGLMALFSASSFATTTTIRVLLVWSPNAIAQIGGLAGVPNFNNQLIAQANEVMTSSGIGGNTTYPNSIQFQLASSMVIYSLPAIELHPSVATDAILNYYPIIRARDDNNADIVMAINNWDDSISTRGSSLQYDTSATTIQNAANAFGTITIQGISSYSFVHELGHLFGAAHQEANGYNPQGYVLPNYAHPYLKNYIADGTYMCYVTLMMQIGYLGDCYLHGIQTVKLNVFSNTVVTAYGQPLGNGAHNNAKVIHDHAPTIGTYHTYKLLKYVTSKSLTVPLFIVLQ